MSLRRDHPTDCANEWRFYAVVNLQLAKELHVDGILQYDRAREHTHQQMMHLYYRAGYRTGALRQYERCVTSLREELDVGPSRRTIALYEQIRNDRLNQLARNSAQASTTMPAVREVLDCLQHLQASLQHLQASLQDMQQQVQRASIAAEYALGDQPSGCRSDETTEVGLRL